MYYYSYIPKDKTYGVYKHNHHDNNDLIAVCNNVGHAESVVDGLNLKAQIYKMIRMLDLKYV